MTDTPTGEIREQITQNKQELEEIKVKLEAVVKVIGTAEKDLAIAKREGREVGDFPFWVSTQGNQHRVDTLNTERWNLELSRDLKVFRGRGLERQLKVIGEYREWVSKKKGELGEIIEGINKARREIQRLQEEKNENKRRLKTLEEGDKEIEEIEWDNWSNYNLTQRNLYLESELIERASKIEIELRSEGELESSEEDREGSDSEEEPGHKTNRKEEVEEEGADKKIDKIQKYVKKTDNKIATT